MGGDLALRRVLGDLRSGKTFPELDPHTRTEELLN